jgi:AI-2 transport protein TqsA
MFLSTPLAVMAMAILAEFRGSRWMAMLLSGDGEPYADEEEKHAAAAAARAGKKRISPPRTGAAPDADPAS